MITKIFVLTALVKLLLVTENPMLCAGLYTGVRFAVAFAFGGPFLLAVVGSAIAFGFAFLYFWLLNRFLDTEVFWVVLVLGLVIGLI